MALIPFLQSLGLPFAWAWFLSYFIFILIICLILMLAVEIFMRRDLSMQVKEAVLKVGMVFLMAVVVFVLYNDISKMLPG